MGSAQKVSRHLQDVKSSLDVFSEQQRVGSGAEVTEPPGHTLACAGEKQARGSSQGEAEAIDGGMREDTWGQGMGGRAGLGRNPDTRRGRDGWGHILGARGRAERRPRSRRE